MASPTVRRASAAPAPIATLTLREGLLRTLQTLTLLAMAGTVATRLWQDHVLFGWSLTAVTIAVWLPALIARRERSWWFVYVAGIFVYTLLRSYADETTIPIRTSYPIEVDRLLFSGSDPIPWLQSRFSNPGSTHLLDLTAVGVHWSFFIVPHAAAIAIYLFWRERFPRYAATVVLTMYGALILFFLLPTAPPWLAAQQGALPGVHRVMDIAGNRLAGQTYEEFYASLGEPNSVAAMPSLHMAITFVVFLWALHHHRRLVLPLAAYAILMFAALLYLGEHYALDMLVGIALATGVYLAVTRLLQPRLPQTPVRET